MELNFRLAQNTDFKDVVTLFNNAIAKMNSIGINQWDNIYPNPKILKDDILRKQMYLVFHENILVATYVLNQECDDKYATGSWKYPESKYFIIHRLCVNPQLQSKGIGTLTMLHIEDFLRKIGVETIRLDAFILNPYAVKMYEQLGYLKVGTANWRKGQFYLMEKKI